VRHFLVELECSINLELNAYAKWLKASLSGSEAFFSTSGIRATMVECTEKSSAYIASHCDAIAVRLAVGGMTCVACARAITEALSKLEGVSDISVNQVGKSASAVVTAADIVESITTVIEDIGYECKVISVTPVVAVGTSGQERTVALEFKGMECQSPVIL
jgi:copper chaperone CopZ